MDITTILTALSGAFAVGLILLVAQLRHAKSLAISRKNEIASIREDLKRAHAEINRKEQVIRNEKSKGNEVSVMYFAEQEVDKGYFSDSHIVRYKFQLLLNGVPVAAPFLIAQDTYKAIDKAQVDKALDNYAKPLIEAGLKVAVQKMLLPV